MPKPKMLGLSTHPVVEVTLEIVFSKETKTMIVVLTYARNECYTHATDKDVKGVTVDHQKREWTYETVTRKWGEMRHCGWGCRYGVIGVYDLNDITHVNSMIYHAKEATECPSSEDD